MNRCYMIKKQRAEDLVEISNTRVVLVREFHYLKRKSSSYTGLTESASHAEREEEEEVDRK